MALLRYKLQSIVMNAVILNKQILDAQNVAASSPKFLALPMKQDVHALNLNQKAAVVQNHAMAAHPVVNEARKLKSRCIARNSSKLLTPV